MFCIPRQYLWVGLLYFNVNPKWFAFTGNVLRCERWAFLEVGIRLPLQSKMLLEASAFSETKLGYKLDFEIIVGLFSCVKEKLSIPSQTLVVRATGFFFIIFLFFIKLAPGFFLEVSYNSRPMSIWAFKSEKDISSHNSDKIILNNQFIPVLQNKWKRHYKFLPPPGA